MANVPELSNFLPTVAHFSRNFGEPPPQWEKILTLTFSLKQWHTSVNMELLSILYLVLEHSQIAQTIIGTRCISSSSAVVIIDRLPDRISESSKWTQNPWNDCRHKDDFSLIGISHRIHAKPNLQIRCRHDLESHFSQCMIDVDTYLHSDDRVYSNINIEDISDLTKWEKEHTLIAGQFPRQFPIIHLKATWALKPRFSKFHQ